MASVAHISPFKERDGVNDRDRLFRIIFERSFKTGDFTLSSGVKSKLYFNMKPTMMNPVGAELSAKVLLELVNKLKPDFISGLEMGAVPVIGAMAAVSSLYNKPVSTTFVRKQPKNHGTRDLIEGLGPNESLEGKEVLIVDDVATSGQSFLIAIQRVREVGGIVRHAACLVNREEGADDLLAKNDVELHAIFNGAEFLQAS